MKNESDGHWEPYRYLRDHLKTQADDLAGKTKKQPEACEFQIELAGMEWKVSNIRVAGVVK
jgi:hypothetical protein